MENSKRLRYSLLTLVIGSLLGLISVLLRGPAPLPNIDVEAWAQVVTGTNYYLAQVLYIFAYVLPYFGFWALYAILAKISQVENLAFWGFMGSIIGTSLALPTLGIFSFISPALATRYLQGDESLPIIITQVATGQPAIINILGGTVYLLGTILLGLAVWRSGVLPKWPGVFIALHGLSLVFGFALYPVLLLSWVLLLISSLWIFWRFTQASFSSVDT